MQLASHFTVNANHAATKAALVPGAKINCSSQTGPQSTNVVFILLENFSLISYASAIEPLRLANKVLGQSAYSFANASLDGAPVRASNGASMYCDHAISDVDVADLIIVCSSDDVEHLSLPKQLGNKLRQLDRYGCQIGGVCTGAFVLAKLGLLDGHICTIHWEYASIFKETFPDIELSQKLVEHRGRRITCAGGTAPMDLMLHFLHDRHGDVISGATADLAIHHGVRDGGLHQRLSTRERFGVCDETLIEAIELMEENIETPLPMEVLAPRVGISTRQLQRAFKNNDLLPPTQFYMNIRLNRARDLLRRTSMAVSEIVYACGFVSPSHFSRCYRQRFGTCAHQDRTFSRPS